MSELADYVRALADRSLPSVVVQQKANRRVLRVMTPDGRWLYAKCGTGPKRREVLREAENARSLAAQDFGPEVVASGLHEGAAWLLTAEALFDAGYIWSVLSGSRSSRPPSGDPPPTPSPDRVEDGFAVWGQRREAIDRVGEALREFHDAGFSFPDITSYHTFVRRDRRRLWVIDAARLERHRGPAPVSRRIRDLAALLFSLEPIELPFTRTGTARLVHAALGRKGDALRECLRSLDREILRLAARTRWRHEHCSGGRWEPGRSEPVTREFRFRTGLSTCFRRLTDPRAWEVVRTLPDRTNLRRARRGRRVLFAKKYPPTRARTTPAMAEVEAIERFRRAGILVHRPAIHAEDVQWGSMLAVHACRGEPLDDLLRRGVSVAERRALAVQTARIWRRMRECGLRHRDAYPCHAFVAPWTHAGEEEGPAEAGTTNQGDARAVPLKIPPDGGRRVAAPRFEIRLIDLTRAGLAPFPKERWFVKDAAQLWHGLPKPPVTRTDAVRWLREYFRVPKLTREAKRFARKVAAKERSIAAHVARKARRAGKSR